MLVEKFRHSVNKTAHFVLAFVPLESMKLSSMQTVLASLDDQSRTFDKAICFYN